MAIVESWRSVGSSGGRVFSVACSCGTSGSACLFPGASSVDEVRVRGLAYGAFLTTALGTGCHVCGAEAKLAARAGRLRG